jgi:hypothetical protein
VGHSGAQGVSIAAGRRTGVTLDNMRISRRSNRWCWKIFKAGLYEVPV